MALGHVEPVDEAALRDEWRREVQRLDESRRTLLVAERDGALVAMALIVRSAAANARHRAEVQRVAVAKPVRGLGIGRRLMAAVEEHAVACGLTVLWLTTHDDTDACAFYEACGYTKLGVMPDYSAQPDGTLAPGAFYYRLLTARRP
jgi:ribosomal protein S18 acetylase RimI-like enzyme